MQIKCTSADRQLLSLAAKWAIYEINRQNNEKLSNLMIRSRGLRATNLYREKYFYLCASRYVCVFQMLHINIASAS